MEDAVDGVVVEPDVGELAKVGLGVAVPQIEEGVFEGFGVVIDDIGLGALDHLLVGAPVVDLVLGRALVVVVDDGVVAVHVDVVFDGLGIVAHRADHGIMLRVVL